jgi:Ca2+-binding RTX toxin-like protein
MRRRRSRIAALAFAACVLALSTVAAIAVARPFIGTRGDDVINGTERHDFIFGRAGNDTLNGFGRRDVIFGGYGNDTVNAGDGNDLVFGGPGDDTLNGDGGNDRIFAQRGVDTVNGGAGNDDLWSLARADVTYQVGEPADTLNGGPGNDVFHVRDGEPDHVTCGPGYDVVLADYKDVVANDCELVKRDAARPRAHDKDD